MVVTDIDHLGLVISPCDRVGVHAGRGGRVSLHSHSKDEAPQQSYPRFAGGRFKRADPKKALLQALDRRVMLLGRAIYFGVVSALVTSAL